jgi:hypothetical protein
MQMRSLLVAIATFCAVIAVSASAQEPAAKGHHLFVWAGDRAKADKDFIAVIDADPASPTYGQLLASAATDQTSNNPHHTEYWMPASGC